MSYNMRVLPLPDDDIQRIAMNPRVLEQSAMADAATELYDQWREIDYILGGQSFLLRGDVVLKQSANEPAHAILSKRVPQLASELERITDGEIRERLSPERMAEAGRRVPAYHNVDSMLRDILPAIYGLRTAVARAAAEQRGLVIWRYEWL